MSFFERARPFGLPEWRSGDAIYDVKGDFGSLRDAHGTLIYTPNTPGAIVAGRFDDWAAVQRASGTTHWTVGAFEPAGMAEYPGYPLPNPDMRDPVKIRALLELLLNTPSADGLGYTPIVFFDPGGSQEQLTPRQRVDRHWPIILEACTKGGNGRDLRDYIIPCPGYELIFASDWVSADISYGLQWLHAHGFTRIAVHNSPGRSATASNPLEGDDPWHGDEAGSFMSHGGEFVEIQLFQIDPPRPTDNLGCDYYFDAGCWFNRFNDCVTRCGAGYRGWRKLKKVVFFESVVYWAIRDYPGVTPQFAKQVADRAKYIAAHPLGYDDHGNMNYTGGPVSIGYGNGLPY